MARQRPSAKNQPKKDHPTQAIDTDLPDGETVNQAAWDAMRDEAWSAMEGLKEEDVL